MPSSHANSFGVGVIIFTPTSLGSDGQALLSDGAGNSSWGDVFTSPTTLKGDLIVNNGSADVALPVGTNGFIILADSTQPTGLRWIDPATEFPSPLTTQGDIRAHNGTGDARLPLSGNDGDVLTKNDSDGTFGISWEAPSGEQNTTSNEGGGVGQIGMTKVGVNLPLKTLTSSNSSVVITNNPTTIDLQATGVGGGEVNAGENDPLGNGVGVYSTKNGVNLVFRTFFSSDSSVIVSQNSNDLDFTATAASVGADPAGSASTVQSNLDAHVALTGIHTDWRLSGQGTIHPSNYVDTVGTQFATDINDLTTTRTIAEGEPLELAVRDEFQFGGGQTLIYRTSAKPSPVDGGWSFDAHGSTDWYQAADRSEARLDRFGWQANNSESKSAINLDAFRRAWDASRFNNAGNAPGAPLVITPGYGVMDSFEMVDSSDNHKDSELVGHNAWIKCPSTEAGSGKAFLQMSIGAESHKEGILRSVRVSGEIGGNNSGVDRGAFPLVEITSYAVSLEHCYFEYAGNDNAACLRMKQQQMVDIQFCHAEGNKTLTGPVRKETIGFHIDSVRSVVMRHCRAEGVRVGCLIDDATMTRTVIPSTRIEAFYAEGTPTAIECHVPGVQVEGVYSTDDSLINVHLRGEAKGCVLRLQDSQGYCLIDKGCSGNTIYVRKGSGASRVIDNDGRNKVIETQEGTNRVSKMDGDPEASRQFDHNFAGSFAGNFRSQAKGSILPESVSWENVTVGGSAHGVIHVSSSSHNIDFTTATGYTLQPGWNYLYFALATDTPGVEFGIELRDDTPATDEYYDADTDTWTPGSKTEWFSPGTEPQLLMYPIWHDGPGTRTCRIRGTARALADGGDFLVPGVVFNGVDTFTATAHGIKENQHVYLTGTPPTGFSLNQSYFAVNVDNNTFQLALYKDDTALTGTGSGSGLAANVTAAEIRFYYLQSSEARNAPYLYRVNGNNFGSSRAKPKYDLIANAPAPTDYPVGTEIQVVNDTNANNGVWVAGGAAPGNLATAWVKNTAAGAGGGEVNHGLNVGGELAEIYAGLQGTDLRFRTLKSSDTSIGIAVDGDTLDITANTSGSSQWDDINGGINYDGGAVQINRTADAVAGTLLHTEDNTTLENTQWRLQGSNANAHNKMYLINDQSAGATVGITGSAYALQPTWANRYVISIDDAIEGMMWKLGNNAAGSIRYQSSPGTDIGEFTNAGFFRTNRFAQTTENKITPAAASGAIDLKQSNHYTYDLTGSTGPHTINFTVPAESGAGRILLKQHETASLAVSFAGGTILAPTPPDFSQDPAASYRVISWTYDEDVPQLILLFSDVLTAI